MDFLKRARGGLFNTEAEYRADPSKVVAHAAEVGDAIVIGPDGQTRFMISIPPAEPSDSD